MILSIMSSGLEQALDDVGAVLRLLEPELGPAADDLDLVVDVVPPAPRARLSVRGTPSTSATMLTAKFVCNGVCL